VGRGGLEPPALALEVPRSFRLSYLPGGVAGRSRTDTWRCLRSLPLPLGYGHGMNGAPGGTRTHTNLFLRQVPLPLGYRRIWSRQQESNLRPAAYKAAALPAELRRRIWYGWLESNQLHPAPKAGGLPFSYTRMVQQDGLEPSALRFGTSCSVRLSYCCLNLKSLVGTPAKNRTQDCGFGDRHVATTPQVRSATSLIAGLSLFSVGV
jgi:hypothetical protein